MGRELQGCRCGTCTGYSHLPPRMACVFFLWAVGLFGHLGSLAPTASGREGLPICPRLPPGCLAFHGSCSVLGTRNMASDLEL